MDKIFNSALLFAMCVMKKYLMLPHYSEKYNVIVDVSKQGVGSVMVLFLFLYTKFQPIMKKIVTLFKENFNGFAAQTFICNYGMAFKLGWSAVSRNLFLLLFILNYSYFI